MWEPDRRGRVRCEWEVVERPQAEQWMRECQEQFRSMVDALPQIVWVTRPDGWHEYNNWRWYDYTGMTPELSIG